MIHLYTFQNRLPGTPDPSGFVVKAMTILSLAGLPYERVEIDNPSKGPKGKVPYIEDNGVVIGDSSFIIDHLKQTQGVDLDAHLSVTDRARSHVLQRMLEERLYWVIVYSRWIDPVNRHIPREVFFASVPWLFRWLITRMATRTVQKALHHQGLGRHTASEIYGLGIADISALSELLGDKPFLFGERPSTADASAYGMLLNIAGPTVPSPLRDAVHADGRLMTYIERMSAVILHNSREMHQKAA